jgi:molecular chaperone DnaK
MRSLTTDLKQALMQIGSAVYAKAGADASNPNPTSPPSGNSEEDVIDADFV